MDTSIKITQPHDGDVLNRHDGVEKGESLTVTVRGSAPSGVSVVVNGRDAVRDGETFSCELVLWERRNAIIAKAEGMSDEIVVLWDRGSRKRFRFSMDDNICFLKDLGLNPGKYASLFDHWYLGFLRDMHREFDTRVHINIYFQADGFNLTMMPDKWKDEWRKNASWLHLSFHALADKPDRPYSNATYAQIAHDYDLVYNEIHRFAGHEVIGNTTTLHWAECPKDAAIALRNRGIENLVALFDRQGYEGECTTGYYLSAAECAYCDTRAAWYDRETDLIFVRCASVVNTLEVDAIPRTLDARTATPQTAELLELLIHEQYFRKELSYYQPTVLEKVRTALRWAVDHGYKPVFWSDGFLGTP